MKFDFRSALMGACLVFGLFGLNSFRAPMRECLTQEQEDVLALLSVTTIPDCVSGPGYTTLVVTGANLQVVNGTGYTDTTNGLGNVIVGYNEMLGCEHSGSHNVIIGMNQAYSSFSGLTAGYSNQILDQGAVAFGLQNIAAEDFSTILGGVNNTASSVYSTVCGGADNSANAGYSVICGGQLNVTSANYGAIGGGYDNEVESAATHGVVSGGESRSVDGNFNWRAGSLLEND